MRNLIYFLLFGAILASCSGENGEPVSSKCIDGYDQTTLLDNIKNTLIIPSIESHQNKLEALTSAIETFTTNPTSANLEQAQSAFKTSYIAFQAVAQYDFGPAETIAYRSSLNNFPADKSVIDNNISSGLYNFNIEDTYEKGYPALDYLLFSNDHSTVIRNLNDNANFRKYLTDITSDMTTRTQKIVDAWNGDFGTSFSTNTGTAAGTSLSQVINEWNKNYEITKRDRIAIPAGILSVGETFPQNVEAYYSGISLELIDASLKASEALYLGGLDELLVYVDAKKSDTTLDATIKNQYNLIKGKLTKVTQPLSQAVDNQTTEVADLYKDATQMVLFTKTDLPTAVCISITYVENPSDSD